MYRIEKLNKIAPKGLDLLPRDSFEVASELSNPDAILVRSAKMHELELPKTLLAIARAGAGVNNIPVEKCTEKGIVVFNTPGANANSVKELVLTGLMVSSREIIQGVEWAKTLAGKGDEIPKLVEKGKSQFAGQEIKGKRLGVIGLGAIGTSVANDAKSLGMDVYGFDPFISVNQAWRLSRSVKKAPSLDYLIAHSDYLTVHVPLTDNTKGLFDKSKFDLMKDGVKILNFSRGGLVNNQDLADALESGKVGSYVTDFPDEELLAMKNVICIPHLGASTEEAEENCAVMAVEQVREFLETGNIKNSVNFPDCEMAISGPCRLIIANKNVPNMVGQISTLLASESLNINDMLNRGRGEYAFNIIDLSSPVPDDFLEKVKQINGVVMARIIHNY